MESNEKISFITVKQENEEDKNVPIGTTVDLVDYDQEHSLKDILGDCEDLINNSTTIIEKMTSTENDLTDCKEDLSELKQTINNISVLVQNLSDRLNNIPDVSQKAKEVFQEELIKTRIATSNILWNNGWNEGQQIDLTLREVLGDLLNFPGGVSNLRQWMESVQTRLSE